MEESKTIEPKDLPYVPDERNKTIVFYVVYVILLHDKGIRYAIPIQSDTRKYTIHFLAGDIM